MLDSLTMKLIKVPGWEAGHIALGFRNAQAGVFALRPLPDEEKEQVEPKVYEREFLGHYHGRVSERLDEAIEKQHLEVTCVQIESND